MIFGVDVSYDIIGVLHSVCAFFHTCAVCLLFHAA